MFGGNFGSNTSTFGGVGFPNTTANTNVFGQQQQQTPVNNSLFGSSFNQQPKPTFGATFGSPQNQGMFGQANRLPTPSAGGLFSSQTATVSPFSSGQTQVPNGTSIQFNAINGSDTMMKNGQPAQISTRHQCITCMKEYENKSLEELRLEDYQLNRKGPQQGLFGSMQQPQQSSGLFSSIGAGATSAPFGQTTSFGANTTGSGLFSSLSQQKPAGSFFSTPATSSAFGATNTAFSFNNPTSQPTSVFGANNNTASTGGLGTSTFSFGQPQNQNTGLFGQKPLTSAPSTGFGGFGASAFTNTSTSNKPTVGFSTGFGTNTTPSFGATNTPTFGTGTGSLFGSQTPAKPFSFGTPFPSQTQPTQSTFGAPTTAFSFNTTTTSAPTLGFGTSQSSFGGTGTLSTNTFSSPFGTSTQPTLGFGQTTTSNSGFGNFAPTMTLPQQQQQQQQAAQQSGTVGFATTPYKDSPLFYNLIANRDLEGMIKPTSPAAQRAIKEASRRRTSTSLCFPSNAGPQKNLTFPSASSKFFHKQSIFDGFEDEDRGMSIDILSPKTSVKKLALKNFRNPTATSHRHSISFTPSSRLSTSLVENGLNDSVSSDLNVSRGPEMDNQQLICADDILQEGRELVPSPLQEKPQRQSGGDGDYALSNGIIKEKNKSRVVNTRPGYYIHPALEELDKLVDEHGNCMVKDFVIGRQNHGEIRYIGTVNVAGVNIDEIVHFRHKEVVVYPDDSNKVPVGEGLNCPAIVSLERVWPIDKTTKNPIKFPAKLQSMGYEDILRKACQRLGAEFVSYEPEAGVWTFKVPHFSKYSCDLEESQCEVDIREEPQALSPLSSLSFSTPRSEVVLLTEQETFLEVKNSQTNPIPLLRSRIRGQTTTPTPAKRVKTTTTNTTTKPLAQNYVTAISRKNEEQIGASNDVSVFGKLTWRSADAQKYKAMPRVVFGPKGSFLTVSNIASSKSPRVFVNKIKSYEKQINNAVYIEVLEEQMKRYISNKQPKTKLQIDALLNFSLSHKSNPIHQELNKEIMMWELFHILWTCEGIRYELSKTLDYRILTRDKVSKWFSKYCHLLFPKLCGSENKKTMLNLLKAGRREEACQLAVAERNYYLALLISQAPLTRQVASTCEEQLATWEQEGGLSFLTDEIKTVYRLCAGSTLLDQVNVEKMTTAEWLQHLAIYLWYCCPHNIPVDEAIVSFQQLLKMELAKQTGWAGEGEVGAVSFPAVCDSSVPNLCIHLLKFYSFDGYPLEKLVDPRTYSEDCMDYKLSWLLMGNFLEYGYGDGPSELIPRISIAFANQLEQLGLYPWGMYALLFVPLSSYHRQMVERNLGSWEAITDERFLMRHQLVRPSSIMYEAKAIRASPAKDREYSNVWYLIKSGNKQKAFDELEKAFTVDLICSRESSTTVLDVLDKMKDSSDTLRNWQNYGAFMYSTLLLLQARASISKRTLNPRQCNNIINGFLKNFIEFHPKNENDSALFIELTVMIQKIVSELIANDSISNIQTSHWNALLHLPVPKDYTQTFLTALLI